MHQRKTKRENGDMQQKWESVCSRAKQDTSSTFGTVRFWLFDLLLVTVFTVFVLRWQPSWAKEGNAMMCYQVLVPVSGAILGLVIVFLISLFCAPYRQRNEARTGVEKLTEEKETLNQEYISQTNELLKKVTDPIVFQAQGEHINEIEAIIKEWEAALVTPMPYSVYMGIAPPTLTVEAKLLFGDLRKHLPYSNLWRDYSTWSAKLLEYFDTCNRLRSEIDNAWKVEDTERDRCFANMILTVIVGKEKELRYRLFYETSHIAEIKYQELHVNGLRTVQGQEMSKGKCWEHYEHEQCSNMTLPLEYQKVADSFLGCDKAIKTRNIFLELGQLETNMHTHLQDILLRRDWVKPTCVHCPISLLVSHEEGSQP